MAGSSWKKSPPELVASFETLVATRPELQPRKMFGYPAAFVGGNLATALHEDRWMVRLPEDARAELLAVEGATLFEPMPGRPMKEYVVFPESVLADPAAVAGWVDRAIAHARALPAKA